jgi:hypothetical protein
VDYDDLRQRNYPNLLRDSGKHILYGGKFFAKRYSPTSNNNQPTYDEIDYCRGVTCLQCEHFVRSAPLKLEMIGSKAIDAVIRVYDDAGNVI